MKKKIRFSLILSLLLALVLPGQPKENLIKNAQQNMDMMNYSQAIRDFEQVLRDDPGRKNIRPKAAFAYFKRSRYEEAVRVLEEEIHLFPDDWDAYILLSYVQFSRGLHAEAAKTSQDFEEVFENFLRKETAKKRSKFSGPKGRKKLIQEISEENPNIGLPSFILGYDLKNQGQFEKASKIFQEALLRKYDPIDCTIQLIDLELAKEDWQAALQRIDDAIKMQGDQAEFYMLRGYALYNLKRRVEAVLSFETAVERKPYLAEAKKNLAKIHYIQHNFKKSASLLHTIIKISSSYDFEAHYLLEKALKEKVPLKEESPPRLTKELADSVQLKYKYVFATNIKTVAKHVNGSTLSLIQSGRLQEARQILRNFLSLNDPYPKLNYNLAQVSNITGALGDALKYAWRATQLKPDYRDAYDLLGNIFFKVGDFNSSLGAYEKALQIDSKDSMAHFNMACVYSAISDLSKAEEHFRKAIQHENQVLGEREKRKISKDELDVSLVVLSRPLSFEAHKALGKIYLQQNQKDKALVEFENAIAFGPSDPESYYEAGIILLAQKNITKAVVYFEKHLYLGGKKGDEVQKLLKKIKFKNSK